MAKINELKLRNTSKLNLVKNSKKAKQYDFLIKKGVQQDDIGFMSILDVPITSPLTGKQVTLSEYLNEVATASIELKKEVQIARKELKVLDSKYNVVNKQYSKILEIGAAKYLQMLLTT